MNKQNYQKQLDSIIKELGTDKPRLLLHACCAPCSSYVLEYLQQYFDITLFFCNPNMDSEAEYLLRRDELVRLTQKMGLNIPVIAPDYDSTPFYAAVEHLAHLGEGSERCHACFRLRLEETAKAAAQGHYDWFTTTLTISPLKNAEVLNTIGKNLGEQYGVSFLPSDFKKKGGYLRSTQLSKEYHLYRQDYCGCFFSKREAEQRNSKKEQTE